MYVATMISGFALYCGLVYVTGQMALMKGRRPKGWMWATAILCPFPLLLLALLPDRKPA